MNEFKKRQRLKKILYSRAILVLLVVVCLFLTRAVWDIFWKYRGSVADERQLQSKLAGLSSQEVYLASSTEELESQSGVEYALQEKFGAVKAGEKEIVLVNASVPSASSSALEGFFEGIWNWFSNL